MTTAFAHLQLSAAERELFDKRYAHVLELPLLEGSHEPDNDVIAREMCVMEAASYVAGEPWSDAPACVCPSITSFMTSWNDALPTDADRNRLLKPLIPKIIGTKSTDELHERRAFMAFDWLVRVHVPTWLELVEELKPCAIALRELPEVVDLKTALACGDSLKSAAGRAGAAWDAARDAAWDAARDAAWAAAWDAARDAAWDAAWAAAWAALKPTVEVLQASAQQLVLRMCEAKI